MEPETYNLVINIEGYESISQEVEVIAGDVLGQDFSLELIEAAGTISGKIDIINGTDEHFAVLSCRQILEDQAYIEILSTSVANGSEYNVDLPLGTYSVYATFTSGDSVQTFKTTDPVSIEDQGDQTGDQTDGQTTESHKVKICHKGKSITISRSALSAHLKHGDTEGACNIDDNNSDGTTEDLQTTDETNQEETDTIDPESLMKVTICHKNKLITISRSALQAHLNHGDKVGSCEDTDVDTPSDGNTDNATDEGTNLDGVDETPTNPEDMDSDTNDDNSGTDDVDDTNPADTITVCHHGKPLTIAQSALTAHLNHSDVLGDCTQSDGDNGAESDDSTTSTGSATHGNGNSNNNGKK